MSTENLWGNIPLTVSLDTPVSILKQQAAALGRATKGLLTAKVQPFGGDRQKSIAHELTIVAPALSNYSVTIVSVIHGITLYPVRVISDVNQDEVGEAENPDELKELLRLVFQSDDVQKIVRGLVSQSISEGSEAEE